MGGSPEGIARTLFTDPGTIASALLTRADLVYVVALALPLAGSFFLAPGLAAVALPQLAINGLSDWPATVDSRHHYVAAAIPFLVAASVLGLSRVPAAKRVLGVTLVLAFSVGSAVAVGPWPGAPSAKVLDLGPDVRAGRANALRAAVALVPEDAAVSATNKVGSHLSARRYFYSLPVISRAEWIVLDTRDPWLRRSESGPARLDPEVVRRFVDGIRSNLEWRRVLGREGVLVFRKVPGP